MKKQKKQTFTAALVESLIEKYGITVDGIERTISDEDNLVWHQVYTEIKKLSPAQLGMVAANGKGYRSQSDQDRSEMSLYQVHWCGWLDKYASGKNLLRCIATTAIIAMAHDLLTARESATVPTN